MSRKKKHEHVNHERWLVSYADFITLLFAFFVVLFSAGQADKKKKAQLALSMQQAFTQNGIFEAHSKQPPLTDLPGTSDAGHPAPIATSVQTEAQKTQVVKEDLGKAAHNEIARGQVRINEVHDGITISLAEAGFFASGSAELDAAALPVLQRIAAALPDSALRVEGHTDPVPIRTAQFASNWELSSARASTIARLLLAYPNVHADRLSVAGYAEFHPIADNSSAEGRARNRRVDIVVEKLMTP